MEDQESTLELGNRTRSRRTFEPRVWPYRAQISLTWSRSMSSLDRQTADWVQEPSLRIMHLARIVIRSCLLHFDSTDTSLQSRRLQNSHRLLSFPRHSQARPQIQHPIPVLDLLLLQPSPLRHLRHRQIARHLSRSPILTSPRWPPRRTTTSPRHSHLPNQTPTPPTLRLLLVPTSSPLERTRQWTT